MGNFFKTNFAESGLYKKIKTSKLSALSEEEKSLFDETRFKDDSSCAMPSGYNYSTQENEAGFINLEYLDIIDFLPKENIDDFKASLKKCISKNNLSFFSHYISSDDDKRIDNIGYYMDYNATSSLCTINLRHNKYLKQNASAISISLKNLSNSFLLVIYRFKIEKEFKDKLNLICKSYYPPYSSVVRGVNVSWHQPKRFGLSLYTGNDARAKSIYSLISKLKWKSYKELRHYFSINFDKIHLFPPTFETFSTNIRPSDSIENRIFWQSIGLGFHTDYAPKFNICTDMNYECGSYEGMCFSAYCGGKYSSNDYDDFDFYQYYISDVYAVYLVASSINSVAKRDLAKGNKKISRAISKKNTTSILRVRANAEQSLYYSYRFISEFTGNTINLSRVEAFHNPLYKDRRTSETEECLKGIAKLTANTKEQIDALFKILNDIVEYGNSKLNLKIQYTMMTITLFSLIVAILAMLGVGKEFFISVLDYIMSLF